MLLQQFQRAIRLSATLENSMRCCGGNFRRNFRRSRIVRIENIVNPDMTVYYAIGSTQ